MIQAILFDFNGVIIDDEPLQMKIFQQVLSAEGIPLTEEEYYGSLGMDDATFVRASYERAGQELAEEKLKAILEDKASAHRELLMDELPLFPGVVNFVKALSREYALGIVSMEGRPAIDFVLERAALVGIFDIIVSTEDVSTCKPDPGCYNRGLEFLNKKRSDAHVLPLQASECLAVEDSPPGIEAARRAGMRTLGVTNTVSEKLLREAGADIVTRSLVDWTTDAVRHVYNGR